MMSPPIFKNSDQSYPTSQVALLAVLLLDPKGGYGMPCSEDSIKGGTYTLRCPCQTVAAGHALDLCAVALRRGRTLSAFRRRFNAFLHAAVAAAAQVRLLRGAAAVI
ncbi:prokineticin Bm8-d-like [Ixodes scapularis]